MMKLKVRGFESNLGYQNTPVIKKYCKSNSIFFIKLECFTLFPENDILYTRAAWLNFFTSQKLFTSRIINIEMENTFAAEKKVHFYANFSS